MSRAAATSLPVIEIKNPCPVDFHAMPVEGRARYCAHCDRHVHDLSAMRSDEVADLICQNAGQLCVRFEQAADGQIVTLDYARPTPRRWTWEWLVLSVLAIFGAGALDAWMIGPKTTTTWQGDIWDTTSLTPPAPGSPAAPASPALPAPTALPSPIPTE
jgi:hypothetical protein